MKSFRTLVAGALLGAVGMFAGAAFALTMTGTNSENNRSIFEVGFLRIARDTAITATPSGTQGTSYQLTTGLNRIATVASGNDGVKLPACTGGLVVVVSNQAASNSANVFPSSGDAINALSANSAFALAANKTVIFFCGIDGTWTANLTA